MDLDLLDYEFTKMLNDLGFPRKEGDNWYPSYWEVKKWLWEVHKIYFDISPYSDIFVISSIHVKSKNVHIIKGKHDSPVTAEIEGIKEVIQNLHRKLKVS